MYLSGCVRDGWPVMLTPMMGNRLPDGVPWAADTGCFAAPEKYTDDGYLAWLAERAGAADRCVFATAPDVVADAEATLARSEPMYERIRALGYRVALVAQDGLEGLVVPWDRFDALFIGGTTEWKLGEAAVALVSEAKRRGKWVHMGRVNSYRRMRLAESIGCDSADGTYMKFGPDINEPKARRWMEHIEANPILWGAGSWA
jgi:hypothetical protein